MHWFTTILEKIHFGPILGHILAQKQQKKISPMKVIHVDFKSL